MSRLFSLIVIVLTQTLFVQAESITIHMCLSHVFIGLPEEKEADSDQVELIISSDKPKTRVGLNDVDLKQLVAIDMMNVTGMPQSAAEDAIREAGLKVNSITYDYTSEVPPGLVTRQDPPPETVVRRDDGVDMTVSGDLNQDLNHLTKRVDKIWGKMATKGDIESLQGQINDLEDEVLDRWDVALVFGAMIAAIVFVKKYFEKSDKKRIILP